jgi:hypothetical protein
MKQQSVKLSMKNVLAFVVDEFVILLICKFES